MLDVHRHMGSSVALIADAHEQVQQPGVADAAPGSPSKPEMMKEQTGFDEEDEEDEEGEDIAYGGEEAKGTVDAGATGDGNTAAAPEQDAVEEEETESDVAWEPLSFELPEPQGFTYFHDGFKHTRGINKKWIVSKAKKEGVDENIAKYNGEWEIAEPEKVVLTSDYGLLLKSKARHHAINAQLDKPFHFSAGKPLIVQYDINFQNGQECGGAYIKLLESTKKVDLAGFHDKTPYSVMFGPDKCGLTSKLHFIVRHKNPKSGSIQEKHAKQPDKSIESYITDKKTHLYTLVIQPDNSYEIYIDQSKVLKGNLLETLEPSIIPVQEIDDPNDKKPADWDEREKISDPDAKKPDDWDESQPEMVDDMDEKKPEGWLDDEPEYIPNPEATKPEDWDEDMDGEWAAPKIENPKCKEAPGCGEWTRKKKKNPLYKGVWKAALISNPNFKGKWKPKKITNPEYFEDKEVFKHLLPIGAIGLELWSMSDGILFDNFIITDDKAVADQWAYATWYRKTNAESKYASKSSFFGGLIESANERPWLWAVYLLAILVPIVLIVVCCCTGGSKSSEPHPKKTDAPMPDDDDEGIGGGSEYDAEDVPLLQPTGAREAADGAGGDAPVTRGDLEGSSEEEEEEEEEMEIEKPTAGGGIKISQTSSSSGRGDMNGRGEESGN
jgi:calnexin